MANGYSPLFSGLISRTERFTALGMVRPRQPEFLPPRADQEPSEALVKYDGRRWLLKAQGRIYVPVDPQGVERTLYRAPEIGKRYAAQAVVSSLAWLVTLDGAPVIASPWSPLPQLAKGHR